MEDIPVYKIRLKLIKIISKRYCRELYLFSDPMDIGYWFRMFQFTIYGQKVYLGISWTISMEHLPVIWTYHLWTLITFDLEATYYFKLILHPLDKTILINGTLILDLLQVNSTRQFLHLMSPSSFVVCKYYGTRYALIHVPNYASSVCMTIFFLLLYNMYDTCVSCCLL